MSRVSPLNGTSQSPAKTAAKAVVRQTLLPSLAGRMRFLLAGTLEHRLLVLILALSLVPLLVMATPLVSGHVPIKGDLGWMHLPLCVFYSDCLVQGESFDWMPGLFSGFFLIGEGTFGFYHPLHLLIYRFLPVDTAFALELYLQCPMMFLGMWLFLRRHVGTAPALMGAMLTSFSGLYLGTLVHSCIGTTLAHIPYILWAMDIAVIHTGPKRKLAGVLIGALTGSQLLLMSPQLFSFSLLAVFAYAIHLYSSRRPSLMAWVAIGWGNLLGLLLGAVQLLSTHSVIHDSVRAQVTFDWIMQYSTPPSELLAIITPHLRWTTGGVYFGVVPTILALWWIGARRKALSSTGASHCEVNSQATANHLALGVLLFTLLTILLGLGKFGGLYYLHTMLPVIGRFRCPCRYMIMAQGGMIIIAAVAFALLVMYVKGAAKNPSETYSRAQSSSRRLWSPMCLPWLAVALSAVISLYSALAHDQTLSNEFQGQWYASPLLMSAAAIALTLAVRGRPVGLFALVILAMIDMGLYGMASPAKVLWRKTPTMDQWAAELQGPPEDTDGRIYLHGFDMNGLATMRGLRQVTGSAALAPTRDLDYHDTAALRVAGVEWFRSDVFQPADLYDVGTMTPEGWQRIAEPLPRVRLVSDAQVSSQPGKDLKRIDVQTTALVTSPLELTDAEPGSARITSDRPGKIEIQVHPNGRELLVLSESYHPGWQIQVDGKSTTLQRVNGDFMGCVVEKNSRNISMEFRPPVLVWGKRLSLLGILIGVCVCVFATGEHFHRRSKRRD